MKFQLIIFVLFLLLVSKLTNSKYLNHCHMYTTCKGCLQNECGWCYSTNTCLPSSEIGPLIGKCPFSQWETDKCKIPLKPKHYIKQNVEHVSPYSEKEIDKVLMKVNPLYVNNTMFNTLFQSWMKIGKKPYDYHLYHSLTNPRGIYKSQYKEQKDISIPSFSLVDEYNTHNFTYIVERQINDLLKEFAFDKITKMFGYKKDKYGNSYFSLLNETKFKNQYEYYSLLSDLNKEKWNDYVKMNYPGVNNTVIYELFEHQVKNVHIQEDNKNYPQSIIHERNYPYNVINSDVSFSNSSYVKFPLTNLTIHSYVESVIIVLQKININGKGSVYKSLNFNEGEEIKSEQMNTITPFNQIEMNKYYIERTKEEIKQFYTIVKTDMTINKKDLFNTISSIVVELPYYNEDIIRKSVSIDLNKKNEKGSFTDAEKLKTSLTLNNKNDINTNLDGYTPKNNYILILKSSTHNRDASYLMKLKIKHQDSDNTKETYRESLSTYLLHLSNTNTIGNLVSVSFIAFDYGVNEIELKAKSMNNTSKKYNQNENVDFLMMKLPSTSQIYYTSFNGGFRYKKNSIIVTTSFKSIPNMSIKFSINKPKNVIISSKVLLSNDKKSDFTFEVYYNGRDIKDTLMKSQGESIINLSSVASQRINPGEYEYEVRYNSNNNGYIDMTLNSYNAITLSIVLFDI